MHEYGVLIGRFQPFHLAHLELVRFALKQAQTLILIIGSANQSLDIHDPWDEFQRQHMIETCLTPEELPRVKFVHAEDFYYNNLMWVTAVQRDVDEITGGSRDVKLIGHRKDASSFYLEMFPQWCDANGLPLEPGINIPLDATKIRDLLFQQDKIGIKSMVPSQTYTFLVDYMGTDEFQRLHEEYHEVLKDQTAWHGSPYQPIFHTTDAVVTCGGMVLVVRRRGKYGRGLIALPGGYLDPKQRLVDSCIRELREETRIKVETKVLKESIKDRDTFDHPRRDLRGRVVTEAFYIRLDGKLGLPKVQGDDDADKAWWMKLNDVDVNKRKFFADHAHIIKRFVSGPDVY